MALGPWLDSAISVCACKRGCGRYVGVGAIAEFVRDIAGRVWPMNDVELHWHTPDTSTMLESMGVLSVFNISSAALLLTLARTNLTLTETTPVTDCAKEIGGVARR